MTIKPWREIAKPHKDVLEGTFKQSAFAADISLVASSKAPAEYQEAEKFFARTFITEGMRLLLTSVVQRLSGQGGDPVIQLQTAFGGGKTHTMLTVFHLATRTVDTRQLTGIPPILDAAGIADLPYAKVAVLDGIKLSPSQALRHDDVQVNTLWGELAWQLAGQAGYEWVKQADHDGTSPGKEALTHLLRQAAPCVILIDELLAFIRQFKPGVQLLAGTFDSNLSFIQALTEALKGWEPIIEKEIDGPRSEPFDIDGKDTRFGSVQAARRAARTIFLGSAPGSGGQDARAPIRGIKTDHVLLGSVQPGQTVSVFEDVLKRLRDRLHYLYAEEDRLWFDTKPNLRREMESRKQKLSDKDHVQPLLRDYVRRVFGNNHCFAGIHVFTPSADVPDDYGIGPRLVVLPINQACYSKDANNQAFAAAEQILRFRGDQPR
jgi:predicted AAA+ superfamily ATPase